MNAIQAAHQRARGELVLGLQRRGAETVLQDLRQDGCLKARFPRPRDAGVQETVLLNVSGGVAPGDVLGTSVRLAAGARAELAGQAAERFYRAAAGSGPARVRVSLRLEAGAQLAWLPQEGILFDGTMLDRATEVEMAADASFLGVEQLVLGRAAMGERVGRLWLRDLVRLRRDGRLVLHDALRVDGDAGMLGLAATARGAGAFATVVLAAPDAEARVGAARAVLAAADGVEAGVSGWDGVLLARVLAPSGAALRRAVAALLQGLRDGRTLPRVWSC